MSYFNQVQLMGYVGNSVKVYRNEGKTPFATVSMAINAWYQKNGERKTETDWHHLVFYGPLVDIAEKQLITGAHLFVQGKLKNQAWQDKDGNKRNSTQIVVQDLRVLHHKSETEDAMTD